MAYRCQAGRCRVCSRPGGHRHKVSKLHLRRLQAVTETWLTQLRREGGGYGAPIRRSSTLQVHASPPQQVPLPTNIPGHTQGPGLGFLPISACAQGDGAQMPTRLRWCAPQRRAVLASPQTQSHPPPSWFPSGEHLAACESDGVGVPVQAAHLSYLKPESKAVMVAWFPLTRDRLSRGPVMHFLFLFCSLSFVLFFVVYF